MSGMTTTDRNGKHTRYYRCGTAMKGGKSACANRMVNADDREAAVMEKINGVLSNDELLDSYAEVAFGEYQKLQKDQAASTIFMEQQRDKARKGSIGSIRSCARPTIGTSSTTPR